MIGAGVGGALGAGGAALESYGAPMDVEALRSSAEERGRKGSFYQALRAVSEKSLADLSEVSQEHPLASTITGGLVGAGVGAASGPAIAAGARGVAEQLKRIRDLAPRA